MTGKRESVAAKNLADEVNRTRKTLEPIAGHPLTLFRPPMGSVTTSKLLRLWRQGQTVVLWNADPKDFRCASADELREWFTQRPLRAGDIVLLHDHVPHVATVLHEVVSQARDRGRRFVRFETSINRSTPHIAAATLANAMASAVGNS